MSVYRTVSEIFTVKK